MKKLFAMLLALMMVLSLAACGGKDTEVGKYTLESMSDGTTTFKAEDLKSMGMTEEMFTMELKDGGKGTLAMFGESYDVTYGDGKITVEGDSVPYTYKDGKFTINIESEGTTMVFVKSK